MPDVNKVNVTSEQYRVFSSALLGELECPVCLQYMKPPITMCDNGHNICNSCKPQLKNCPLCKGKLLSLRNQSLERISCEIHYPCKFLEYGCKLRFPRRSLLQHLKVCPHRSYACPFHLTNSCNWDGPLDTMRTHVEDYHNNHHYIDVHKYPANFAHTVFKFGETFFGYYRYDPKKDFISCSLMYVGPKENASKYKFRATLYDVKNHCYMKGKEGIVRSYLDDLNENLKPGNCLSFPRKDGLKCIKEDGKMSVEILVFDK